MIGDDEYKRHASAFARSQGDAEPREGGGAPGSGGFLAGLAVAAGAAIAVSYSTVEQFAIPMRGSREFELDRAGIARLLMLAQVVDVATLLPLGARADRRGTPVVLGGVLLVFALALALIGFGTLPMLAVGCALSASAWRGPPGPSPATATSSTPRGEDRGARGGAGRRAQG